VPQAGSVPLPPSDAPGSIPPLPSPVTVAGLQAGLTAASWPRIPLSHEDLTKLLPAALSDKASCPWADVLVSTATSGSYSSCLEFHKNVYREIADLHPSAVFLSGSENSIANLASHAEGRFAQQEWTAGEKATLRALSVLHVPVYVLLPTPVGTNIAECATRFNGPKDCNLPGPGPSWLAGQAATVAAVADRPGVHIIDTRSWVCAQGQCPAVYGNDPIHTDGQHLSEQFARHLAANFLAAVRPTDPTLFASR
jgi:hypothetical protein